MRRTHTTRALAPLAAAALVLGLSPLVGCTGEAPPAPPSSAGAAGPGAPRTEAPVGPATGAGATDRVMAPAAGATDGVVAPAAGGTAAATGADGPRVGRPAGLDGVDLSALNLSTGAERPVAPQAPTATVDGQLLVSGEDTARFGTVIEGEERTHVFDLTVVGEEELVVFDQKSTCGCTVGSLELVAPDGTVSEYQIGRPVPPGHGLRVNGKLVTEGKRGPNHHTITLRHNGKNRATLLHFEADVVPVFEVDPNPYLNFGELFVNETRTAEITITSRVVDRFALAVDTSFGLPEYLHVDLAPVDPDASGRAAKWKLSGTLGPNAPEGLGGQQGMTVILRSDVEFEGAAPLPNGQPRVRVINVYAAARVKGLVHTEPSYVSFGAVSGGNSSAREFTIVLADDSYRPDLATLSTTSVVARDPKDQEFYDATFRVAVTEQEPGRSYVVRVSYENWPGDRIGPFGGDVVVPLGHPSRPELRVPFSGVCRPVTVQRP